uniref:Uncharacterized protein n=1 Tax=viral metagenome TaxID=1070528 RepID=A0A6M3M5T2_9ZZZZ
MIESPKPVLYDHLQDLIKNWDRISIRAKQDGKWQSLYLFEIKDGQQILDWIKSTEGRFWKNRGLATQ